MTVDPTTDPQNERFDLYNATGESLGVSKPRSQVHRDGDWHRSLHLWVWSIGEDTEPFVVFQRRSMTKDTWPGALDVAVGGHFRSGESLAEALREAEEEIGLTVAEDDVVQLGRRFHDWQEEMFRDCEINEAYAVRSDRPLTGYRLHPEEVDELIRISIIDGLRLFRGVAGSIPARSRRRGDATSASVEVSVNEFVDMSDGYAIEALQRLEQLASGKMPEKFIIQANE